jgi:hypothetical protein
MIAPEAVTRVGNWTRCMGCCDCTELLSIADEADFQIAKEGSRVIKKYDQGQTPYQHESLTPDSIILAAIAMVENRQVGNISSDD